MRDTDYQTPLVPLFRFPSMKMKPGACADTSFRIELLKVDGLSMSENTFLLPAGHQSPQPQVCPVPLYAKLIALDFGSQHYPQIDMVEIKFEDTAPLCVYFSREHDCGLSFVQPDGQCNRVAVVEPGANLSWLHPSSRVPVVDGQYLLRSLDLQDWPMAMRNRVFGETLRTATSYLRCTNDLSAHPVLWSKFSNEVQRLLVSRWIQRPHLWKRLRTFDSSRLDNSAVSSQIAVALNQFQIATQP